MDCGIPFCHNGCPLGNLIPEWNDLVYRSDWAAAADRLHATNNFPEFTGRLCPAPCEASCVLGINADPVTIKQVEVEIIDRAWADGTVVPLVPQALTGYTVAVVGSGPAGLAAAQQLTRAGHQVTVFERDDAIGGLLRYGIPEFKMEKRHLERRIAQMEAEGTRFVTGVSVESAAQLDGFSAVVLAGGARVARDLPVPGRDLAGILGNGLRRGFGLRRSHAVADCGCHDQHNRHKQHGKYNQPVSGEHNRASHCCFSPSAGVSCLCGAPGGTVVATSGPDSCRISARTRETSFHHLK